MNNPGENEITTNDPVSPGSSISEMKYTVGTIVRIFPHRVKKAPFMEFVIADRERMVSKKNPFYIKDMYRIRYIVHPGGTTDEWMKLSDLETLMSRWDSVEIYNG